ncbi:MAG: diguanylate cyclase [Flavobacteriaceae bacterium]
MSRSARVVVVESADNGDGGLAGELGSRGLDAARASDSAQVFARLLGGEKPDALVVRDGDLMCRGTVRNPEEIVRRILDSDLSRRVPVILLGQEGARPTPVGVHRIAEPDPDEITVRVESLARLGILGRELDRRLVVARRFGGAEVEAPQARMVDDARIVVAFDPATMSRIGGVLPPPAEVSGAPSAALVLDQLELTAMDALVVPATDVAAALDLIGAVRRDTRHVELPIVAIASQAGEQPALLQAGASAAMSRDADDAALGLRVAGLASEHRYRRAMREAMRAAMPAEALDSLTGLVTHGYFLDWLTETVVECDRWGETVSLVAFEITDMTMLNERHGPASTDRLMRALGRIVASLTRIEDCVCRYTGSRIIAAMPSTSTARARQMRDRIMSVVRTTPFRDDQANMINADITTATTQWRSGASAQGLIEDSFRGLS